MEYDKEPELIFNTPQLNLLKKREKELTFYTEKGYSGNEDWRAKASLQKRLAFTKKEIEMEQANIKEQYKTDMLDYKSYLKEIAEAEEKFAVQDTISNIEIAEAEEKFAVHNTISNIEL